MPDFLKKYVERIKEFWKSLDKSQKTRLYITSVLVAAAVGISIYLIAKPERVVLFSSSDRKQVAEMINILDENGIWNTAENNGTSIIINKKDNNRAQIILAQAGYPKEGFTFEDAISNIGLTTTQEDRKHIWKQQQISDLETKIEMLDNIDEAAVTLAIPETSIFLNANQEQPRPTAYVMVRPNKQLTKTQVEGIVMLVSRSVENLDPNDVTVVDNNGNILNTSSQDDSISVASSQEELRRQREKELEQKVLDYFSGGQFDNFDTLRVVAHVTLDFDKEKSQIKTLSNPEGMDSGAVISSRVSEETVRNSTTGGEPGLESNPGTAGAPEYQTGTGTGSDYSNVTEEFNYGYDEKLTEREKATGKMIPEESGLAISLWYGRKITDDSGMDENFINEIKTAASAATGIPVQNISVSKMKLAPEETIEKTAGERIKDFIENYGFFILMLILTAGLLIAVLTHGKAQEMAQVAPASGPKFALSQQEEPIPEIQLEEKSEIKKQIDKFVRQKPESVAQLLRYWLSEDWEK